MEKNPWPIPRTLCRRAVVALPLYEPRGNFFITLNSNQHLAACIQSMCIGALVTLEMQNTLLYIPGMSMSGFVRGLLWLLLREEECGDEWLP